MKIIDYIKQEKIYGIIREDDSEKAYETARAYLEGGIKFIELNCPTEVTKKVSELKDAVNDAIDNDTIVMENNYSFTDNSKIVISKDLTLDLSGYTIEKTYIDTQYLLDVNANKTLTINDSV